MTVYEALVVYLLSADGAPVGMLAQRLGLPVEHIERIVAKLGERRIVGRRVADGWVYLTDLADRAFAAKLVRPYDIEHVRVLNQRHGQGETLAGAEAVEDHRVGRWWAAAPVVDGGKTHLFETLTHVYRVADMRRHGTGRRIGGRRR